MASEANTRASDLGLWGVYDWHIISLKTIIYMELFIKVYLFNIIGVSN